MTVIGISLNQRYRLQAELGRGGMGVLYRARDTMLDREVAVKVLSGSALSAESRARLLREAQAVAKLNHPNIVSVYDAGEAEVPGSVGTVPFIVMELVEGDSLYDCPPHSQDEIVGIACQVCTALDHAHAHGVIHRDLKPENVLILPDGSAKLVDFGLARTVASRLTAEGAILGTVFYIAPEQALGQEIDGRADLYTLGVMLYEWTAGRLPFVGDDPVALIGQHLHAPVMPPREHNPEIPSALDALIVQLLSKRPEDRPASAAEVRQVLERLVQEPAAEEGPLERPHQPDFLTSAEERRIERPAFVARERELERLGRFLEEALAGDGKVVFVTGGPGRGKTALLAEFARRAMEAHAGLLVASGNCNAYSGVGDPYLPFRDLLGMLTGDVEARWSAGTASRDHALRLWDALPLAVQALVDHGPHVVPTLVPGPALLSRARAVAPTGAPWLQRLTERVERGPAHAETIEQTHLFQQLTNLLRALAEAHPLLLILDDLQWADTASVGLLFHLGRRLEGSRILVAGAYRPEEVALGRQGERHPLEAALAEFKRAFGDVWLDLAEVQEPEGRRFVDAFLDTEPNRLGEGFRAALFAHTAGHPLFTVELLRTLQERGDLLQDESGCWVEGAALHWETLPARVEGVIEARIGRLEEGLREMLSVASVEGEEFTAQVVARVQEVGQRQVLQRLSRELEVRHRLVREQPALRVNGRRLSRYRFAHALFQQYLYNHLGDGERALLHGEVAGALEELYQGHPEGIAAIAPQLARHFVEAGVTAKAAHYLARAGALAAERYANEEAIAHYSQALEYTPEGSPQRLDLLAARAGVYGLVAQWNAQRADLEAVLALAGALEDDAHRCDALIALAECLNNTGDAGCREPAERAAEFARSMGDPLREGRALRFLGFHDYWTGHAARGRSTLEAALARLQAASQAGETAACLADLSLVLNVLDEPTAALEVAERAVALSREAGDRRQEAISLRRVGNIHRVRGRHSEAQRVIEAALALHRQMGDRHEECHALNELGSLLGVLGKPEEATAAFRQMLQIAEEIGAPLAIRHGVVNMVGALASQGEYEAGLAFLETWLAKAGQVKDAVLAAQLQLEKTRLLWLLGQWEPALALAQSLVPDADRLLDYGDRSWLLHMIGYCQAELGRLRQARETYQAHLESAEQAGEPLDAGRAWLSLAYLAYREDDQARLRAAMEQLQRPDVILPTFWWYQQAGARLQLALGEVEQALESSNRALREVEVASEIWWMEQCYLTHARVLRALGRDEEDDDYLWRAYEQVMLVASKIQDADLRQSFLENVPDNREIVAEWEAREKDS